MITIFFWFTLSLLIYIYFGYPLTLFFISKFKRLSITMNGYYPTVAIVIPAHNEERVIKETIENKLSLNYPPNRFSIYVISDGSTDRTADIVKKFEQQGVTLFARDNREGKTGALNYALRNIKSEIIVFSDANSFYDENVLTELLKNFNDPTVGYVTGKMMYVNPDNSSVGAGCSIYMKYENRLRELETQCGSIIGVDGGIDAIRRNLYVEMPLNALPDLILPLKVIERGYRVVYEPKAVLREKTLSSSRDEYNMRIRVALRAFDALFTMKHLFNPLKYGFFSYQLLVHKLLRYTTGIVLICIFFTNLLLIEAHTLYRIFLAAQLIFYCLALFSYLAEKIKVHISFIYPIYYFCLLHCSSTVALLKYLQGSKIVTWEPRKG